MRTVCGALRTVFSTALLIAFAVKPAHGQTVTTSAIAGVAVDPQERALPGVSIAIVHEPTGARSDTVTDGAGRFDVLNLPPGGPFTITATLSGFSDETVGGQLVALGEHRSVVIRMRLAAVQEVVTVVASAFDRTRAGTAASVDAESIAMLPSQQRSLADFARTSPYFNATNVNGGDTVLSVAGRNFRYNNLQIDGAVHNDLFGLSASAVPGGLAGAQPISLDAVQELQLVVAPYDVRQGGFTGGGMNLVTRSGSNRLAGTVYGFGRSERLVGTIPAILDPSRNTTVGVFSDRVGGFSLGGPLARNRAFLFGNLELARKTTPSGFSVSGNAGQVWGNASNVQQAVSVVRSAYGYDPGELDQTSKANDSDKLFVRADINPSSGQRITFRVSDVQAHATTGSPTPALYVMPNTFATIADTTFSTVAQVNSSTTRVFNELRVGWQRLRDERSEPSAGSPFPNVRVDFSDGTSLLLGSDAASHANHLNQDIFELTDDLTWTAGAHTVTAGTHNEFFRFDNLFILNFYGSYRFSSIANLTAGVAQAFARSFSNTADPLQAAQFSVHQLGFYAGDQWRATPRLTVTYGLRADAPRIRDIPHANPVAAAQFGFATDLVPAPLMWSPRAGLTYAMGNPADRGSQLRAGLGLFAGRPPYVWLADQFANTGVDFTAVALPFNAANRIPFIADPLRQPVDVRNAGRQTINLADPAYRYPSVLRGNLAYDKDLHVLGLVATAELLFAKNLDDAAYTNLNVMATGALPDGRPTYAKKDATLNDVILLSNTARGSQWSATLAIDRPFRNGWRVSGSYLFNRATSVNDGTSNIAASNWANTYTGSDVNNPPLATSIYQAGSRITLTGIVPVPLPGPLRSTASVYYNGQSGQPYVLLFSSDANGDGRFNDIVFAPAAADQVVVKNGSWAQLDAYLANDASTRHARGGIPSRNAGTSPWTNTLDVRYAVTAPMRGRVGLEFTLDVVNVLNLLNRDWGWVFYPSANGPATVGYDGITDGKETFNLATINASTFPGTFVRDDLRSRFQAQWGMRLRF